MRLATIRRDNNETAAVLMADKLFPVPLINERCNQNYPENIFAIIDSGRLAEMNGWFRRKGMKQLRDLEAQAVPLAEARFGPLYRRPRKIWGIGLNYADHASDLDEKSPETEPASFMKPDTTIIGHSDPVRIPLQSDKTTAEAELGVIIGRVCRNVDEGDAPDYIAGFTTIIDMTAEDILRLNPRYLTRAKSFDTFFSFGPVLVTPDEIGNIMTLNVATVLNGMVHRRNMVANMTFPPYFLVSFHSRVMTLLPGDIISTGTPGAAVINHGDVVECVIDGFEKLVNPVEDCKQMLET